jgi:hypothetical protein
MKQVSKSLVDDVKLDKEMIENAKIFFKIENIDYLIKFLGSQIDIKLELKDGVKFAYLINESEVLKNKTVQQIIKDFSLNYDILQATKDLKSLQKIYSKQELKNHVKATIVLSSVFSMLVKNTHKIYDEAKEYKFEKKDNKKFEYIVSQFLAFLYKYEYIRELKPMSKRVATRGKVLMIKNNSLGTKVLNKDSVNKRDYIKSTSPKQFEMGDLINRCYKTKYVAREEAIRGKHLSHKSPEPHIRQSSVRRYKNGRMTFIKPVLVNAHKATTKQLEEFYSYQESEELLFKNKFIANTTNYEKQFVS